MNPNKFPSVASSLIITAFLLFATFDFGNCGVENGMIMKSQKLGGVRDITERALNGVEIETLARFAAEEYSRALRHYTGKGLNDVELENLTRSALEEYSRTVRDITEQGLNGVEIENLARFALKEYSKRVNCIIDFDFHRLVKAREEKVQAGKMYHITLETKDSVGRIEVYEAKVWVKPWMHVKEFRGFKAIKPNV